MDGFLYLLPRSLPHALRSFSQSPCPGPGLCLWPCYQYRWPACTFYQQVSQILSNKRAMLNLEFGVSVWFDENTAWYLDAELQGCFSDAASFCLHLWLTFSHLVPTLSGWVTSFCCFKGLKEFDCSVPDSILSPPLQAHHPLLCLIKDNTVYISFNCRFLNWRQITILFQPNTSQAAHTKRNSDIVKNMQIK